MPLFGKDIDIYRRRGDHHSPTQRSSWRAPVCIIHVYLRVWWQCGAGPLFPSSLYLCLSLSSLSFSHHPLLVCGCTYARGYTCLHRPLQSIEWRERRERVSDVLMLPWAVRSFSAREANQPGFSITDFSGLKVRKDEKGRWDWEALIYISVFAKYSWMDLGTIKLVENLISIVWRRFCTCNTSLMINYVYLYM